MITEIAVYDNNWNFVDIIDVYESLIWTERYFSPGDFELYDDVKADILSLLKEGYFLQIDDSDTSMMIEDIAIKTDAENGNKVIYTGRSLELMLSLRIIWKSKVLSGNLQSGFESLLIDNLLDTASIKGDAIRKIPGAVFEASLDPNITALTIDTQYFCDNLFTAVQKFLKLNGIGYRVKRVGAEYQISLYSGTDRSENQNGITEVVFSPEYENLKDTEYLKSIKTYKSAALVGGEGEGDAQVFKYTNDGRSGIELHETFVDASNIKKTVDGVTITDPEYDAKLKSVGDEELEKTSNIESFDGTIENTSQFTYGIDYYMGDIVRIENEYGMESKTRVIELIRSYAADGYYEFPTFEKV